MQEISAGETTYIFVYTKFLRPSSKLLYCPSYSIYIIQSRYPILAIHIYNCKHFPRLPHIILLYITILLHCYILYNIRHRFKGRHRFLAPCVYIPIYYNIIYLYVYKYAVRTKRYIPSAVLYTVARESMYISMDEGVVEGEGTQSRGRHVFLVHTVQIYTIPTYIIYIYVYVHFAAACCFATIASPARHDGSPLLFTMSLMDFVVSRELGCSRATLVSNARVTSPPSPTSPLPSHTCARTSYTHIYIVYIYMVVCPTFVTRAHRSHVISFSY